MLPTSKTRPGTARKAPAAARAACAGKVHGPADPLGPIGPDRLRALREAIRDGTYPTQADVLGGLERMLDL